MRSGIWSVVGVVLTVAMIILSAFINYHFGYSLGTTEANAVLPIRISAHLAAARHQGRGLLGGTVFLILVTYAIAGSVGFGMQNRSQLTGSRENLNAQLVDAVHDRDRAVEQLNRFGKLESVATVRAKIAEAKKGSEVGSNAGLHECHRGFLPGILPGDR